MDKFTYKNRINSINSTRKITSAMALIATSKLNRAKENWHHAIDYYNELVNLVELTSVHIDTNLISSNENIYIIINSNQGLCGPYDHNIINFCDELITRDDLLIVLGKVGINHYHNRYRTLDEIDTTIINNEYEITNRIYKAVKKYIKQHRKVYLIYNKFVTALSFKIEKYLIQNIEIDEEIDEIFKYEPDRNTLVDLIRPLYIKAQIYEKICQTSVSEQASRHLSMENATNSAKDILEKLTLDFSKKRQSDITQEISEIIAGATYKGDNSYD